MKIQMEQRMARKKLVLQQLQPRQQQLQPRQQQLQPRQQQPQLQPKQQPQPQFKQKVHVSILIDKKVKKSIHVTFVELKEILI